MTNINYNTKSKNDLLEEIAKRPELNIDSADKTRDELAEILREDDENKAKFNTPLNTNGDWESEFFELNPSIIPAGYSGNSAGIKLIVHPGIRVKRNNESGVPQTVMVAGEIFVNKQKVEKVTGLNKEAVWTFVSARIILLSKEQETKFKETFYSKK